MGKRASCSAATAAPLHYASVVLPCRGLRIALSWPAGCTSMGLLLQIPPFAERSQGKSSGASVGSAESLRLTATAMECAGALLRAPARLSTRRELWPRAPTRPADSRSRQRGGRSFGCPSNQWLGHASMTRVAPSLPRAHTRIRLGKQQKGVHVGSHRWTARE
eukprot:scaffold25556_cov70-Phaeocystis_antarctica.AAC.2